VSTKVSVFKDANAQHLIPSAWRGTLVAIVDAIKEGDFQLQRGIPGVSVLGDDVAISIRSGLSDYGAELTSLPDDTWKSSVCQWTGSYWDVLVDLYTKEEEEGSDLCLAVRVKESSSGYTFAVHSIHVP
jgi:hypothetical protein